jgi:polyhydroxyalkanoate synthesis regulator phasin
MAQSDVLKRYLDAGAAFTQLTQKRAEAIVSELVSAGEVQASQASQAVQDLIDRSRATTEALLAQVRSEVASQVEALGLATKSDIHRLEKRIDSVSKKTAAKKAPAKKAAPRR